MMWFKRKDSILELRSRIIDLERELQVLKGQIRMVADHGSIQMFPRSVPINDVVQLILDHLHLKIKQFPATGPVTVVVKSDPE